MKEHSKPFLTASTGTGHIVGSFPLTHTHNNRQLPCPFLWSLQIKTLLLADKNQTLPQYHISQTTLILFLFKGKFAYIDCQIDQPFPQTPALPNPQLPSSTATSLVTRHQGSGGFKSVVFPAFVLWDSVASFIELAHLLGRGRTLDSRFSSDHCGCGSSVSS